MDDPVRQEVIKRQLRPGMEITYFEPSENRLIPARVLETHRIRATIQDLKTGKHWTLPLYMINIEGADTDISAKENNVDRLSLKIGDQVGFVGKDGGELFGTVTKLNPKRAKVKTGEGIWSLPYSMLFSIINGEQNQGPFIPAELELFPSECINPTSDDGNAV